MIYAKAYLSGSVLVQKSLLELCNFQQGYAARVVPPELPEKERRRRARQRDSGRRHFRPVWCAIHRPSMKHWGSDLMIFPPRGIRLPRRTTGVPHAAAWRKWF